MGANIGRKVRVKKEIEELVGLVSEKTGYHNYTVRNTAILYGLRLIAMGVKIPRDDDEFVKLLERTREEIREVTYYA